VTRTAATLSLGIILSDTTVIRPDAHGRIGVVALGSIADPYTAIQSTSVDQLLALADAAQEAARLLRRLQVAQRITEAVA
jgi:hypothetical protein